MHNLSTEVHLFLGTKPLGLYVLATAPVGGLPTRLSTTRLDSPTQRVRFNPPVGSLRNV